MQNHQSCAIHTLYLICIYFVLPRTVETLHKITQWLFFPFLICPCPQCTLPSTYPVRRDCKGKELMIDCPVFPVLYHAHSGWLIQGNNSSRKSFDRVPGSQVSWNPPAFLHLASSGWKEGVTSQVEAVVDTACLLCTRFETL